jgi:predicted amidophosphoribosyltransferase
VFLHQALVLKLNSSFKKIPAKMNNTHFTHCPDCRKAWDESEQQYQSCDGCGFPMVSMPVSTSRKPLGYNEHQQWDRLMDDDQYD